MQETATKEPNKPSNAGQKPALVPAAGFTYLPAVDGLRAFSILLVMSFHHLGPATGWIGDKLNGWAGVDLFFIISGFLITSILLKEKDRDGSFSLKNFYVRRWLRICPAYYVFLAFMFGFMLWRGIHDYASFAIAGLYLTNLDMSLGWGLLTARTGLIHTWSLSVEEQFYLLWPATLLLVKDKSLKVVTAILAGVYAWRLFLVESGVPWMRISAGLDTKLDSLMLGVLAALLWRIPSVQFSLKSFFSNAWAQLGTVGAVVAALFFLGHPATSDHSDLLQFWALRMPITLIGMTFLLFAVLSNPNSKFGKLLSSKPLVWIGRLSYSLYLWHIIVNFPETNNAIESLCHHRKYLVEFSKYASCFALASASYYFIEQPFLKLKSKFS